MQSDFVAAGPLEMSARNGQRLLWKIKDTGDGWTGVESLPSGDTTFCRFKFILIFIIPTKKAEFKQSGYVPTSFCSFEPNDVIGTDRRPNINSDEFGEHDDNDVARYQLSRPQHHSSNNIHC